MNKEALLHIPKSNYAYAVDENTLCIRFRSAKKDIHSLKLFYGDKFDLENMKFCFMEKIFTDEFFDYYESCISVLHNRYVYYFEIESLDEKIYFGEYGILENIDCSKLHFNVFQFPYIHKRDLHYIPSWIDDRIFYQIFPDRFYKSDKFKTNFEFNKWNELPKISSIYGGNLLGILEKLEYLEEIGVNAIYLNPIFKSPSNHKYDTTDYFEIDECFGTKEDFKKLVNEAHKRNIKIILDCVFNHCGYNFKYFQDVVEKGNKSVYFDWFYIHGDEVKVSPPNYLTFAFTYKMPKFNTSNIEVRKFLISVVEYWTKEFDIDGWRLDVADEVDHEFWREFRKCLKKINKDILILGENWHDSYPWLQGDQHDGVMNYAITKSCIEYFAERKINSENFSNMISKILIRNKEFVNRSMLNLLDSHDTPRFISYCNDKKSLKLALIFLMTFVGIPCIYYGTEILTEGGGDPDCRRTFNWDTSTWDSDFLIFLKNLIKMRKNEKALQIGKIKIYSKNNLLIMERYTDKELILVVINNSNHEEKFEYKCKSAVDVLNNKSIILKNDFIIENIQKIHGRVFKILKN